MTTRRRSIIPYLLPIAAGITSFCLTIATKTIAPEASVTNTSNTLEKKEERNETYDKEVVAVKESKKTTTLLFTGDIMLARDVERTIKNRGIEWPFLQLTPKLSTLSDVVIGNLETTVQEEERLEIQDELNFDTTPNNLEALKIAGFTHLSLSNNHTDDFGSTVTTETRMIVESHDLETFGDPLESGKYIKRLKLEEENISLIGFHAFNEYAIDIEDVIEKEKNDGQFVIVYPHWGTEYINRSSQYQQDAAKRFIAAGADLIIGSHPHVIQEVEVINGVPVVYSLGNFLFDQDFSEETKTGAMAQVEITPDAIKITFIPIRIVYRQTMIDNRYANDIMDDLGLNELTLSLPRKEVQTQ